MSLFGSVVVILDLWCRGALVLSIFVIILVSWESNLSEFGFKTSGKSVKNDPKVGPGGVSGGSWDLLGALGVKG